MVQISTDTVSYYERNKQDTILFFHSGFAAYFCACKHVAVILERPPRSHVRSTITADCDEGRSTNISCM